MGDRWLPWSAASLASGAVLLVLGTFALPRHSEVADLLRSVQAEDSLWIMAAVAFFLAAVGLTLGLPAIYSLLPPHRATLGMVGLWVWSFGTIGTAGVGAMLILFQAVARDIDLAPEQVDLFAQDTALTAFVLGFLGAFYVGELIITLVLLQGRTVPRWVPLLMLAHLAVGAASPWLPDVARSIQSVMIGVALMGLAVRASEKWTDVRANLRR